MPTMQETHYGVVTNNVDPDKRGRVKVKSQSLVGESYELPFWIEPAAALVASNGGLGALFLPEIGSTVELIVDVHDTDFDDMPGERFLENPHMKWRPGTPSGQGGPMALPADLLTDYPNTRGWVTKAGHKLLFNDKAGTIQIVCSGGGTIVLKQDGSLKMTAGGATIEMTAAGVVNISEPFNVGTNPIDAMMKGTTFNVQMTTLLTGFTVFLPILAAYATAIKAIADPTSAATPPLLAGITALTGVITAFLGAMTTYLSTGAKVL